MSNKRIDKGIAIAYEKGKSTDALVNDGGEVVELEELLNSPDLEVAKKINKLFKYGITINMIKELYSKMPSSFVAKKDDARRALAVIYKTLVMTINDLPNGIVINEDTALYDEEASKVEMKKYGIDGIAEIDDKQEKKILSNIEKKDILDNNVIREFFEKEEADRYIRESFSKKICNLNVTSFKARGKNISEDEKFITIETMDDAEMMKLCLWYAKNPAMFLEKFGNPEEVFEKYKKTKYYKLIIDSQSGKIDYEKLQEIGPKWMEIQNRVSCRKYLKNGLEMIKSSQGQFDPQTLDETQKKYFGLILARGYFSDDPESKKYFEEICSSLGIETTEKDVADMVNSLVHKTITDEADLAKYKKARRSFLCEF